ncbi:DUF397 domain-containing protein [Streptomyces sp. KL116D]|uniref:DUF397 domain-containing protein n=1 Tax=Streptomyces sp. KL116D TaxID=3045152 RepID=UPI003555FA67
MSPNELAELNQLAWRRSSHSNGAGGECLECAAPLGTGALIRDSKAVDGDIIRFGTRAWSQFLRSVR